MQKNRTSAPRRVLLGGLAAVTALLVTTACGSDHSSTGHGAGSDPTSAAPAEPGATVNGVDVRFAQLMIPHHQQAVAMADLAATRAADPELKALAARIKGAQDPEIATMTGWLTAWGKPTAAPQTAGGHGDHGGMPGMMSDGDLAKLRAATGTEFDRMFAEMMIAHHKGAIQMARDARSGGADPAVRVLAEQIETSQDAEVKQLQGILDRL